ncbi:glycosyltransferase family 2 protein [bacterium]|jgi:glycosyltransferase involved in cell wall biosynthesis|nr:glycosyltransferase family 2 protein [bacterium]
MAKIALSIVLPCYNESGNIPFIIERFSAILPSDLAVEVILVNNGSSDDSKIIFEQELSKQNDARFKVVDVPVNKGYGHGILEGLKGASGDAFSWTHADMQTDPADVIKAYRVWKESGGESVFVKGKRLNRAWVEAFFTFGMQVFTLFVLRINLNDINAQPKVFGRGFYTDVLKEGAPQDFSLDLYAYYHGKKKLTLKTIPVYFNKRLHGEAKGGGSFKTRLKLIDRTIRYIWQLKL